MGATLEMKRPMRPAAVLYLPLDERLKEQIGLAADDANLPMNEWVAQILADKLGCPELAKIPRKAMGRPRNQPQTVNGNGHKRKQTA